MIKKIATAVITSFAFVAIGFPLIWAFVLTVNRVIPWVEVYRTADKYRHVKFVVQQSYFNPGGPGGPRSSGRGPSWTVVGRVTGDIPATIDSCGFYNVGKLIKDSKQLEEIFPDGREIDVLFNPELNKSDKLQVMSNFKDIHKTVQHGMIKFLIISYLPLIIDIMIVIILVKYGRNSNKWPWTNKSLKEPLAP